MSSPKTIYLVLELCPGGDLAKMIRTRKRLEEPVAQSFLRQLSDGLHFLSQKNVIHRDLKPANVLLSEDSDYSTLKLADFGFAKHLTEAAMAQTPCGTPLYMVCVVRCVVLTCSYSYVYSQAPEVFEMQDYDAKADLWSVGCIFYEMLVGTPPFKGASPRDLYHNIKSKQLSVPSDIHLSQESLVILQRVSGPVQ
jgi:serine/threonine-protein kinase ULK/ATG1